MKCVEQFQILCQEFQQEFEQIERRSLATIDKFYGTGVYAIYLASQLFDYSCYDPIVGIEWPIYVGKAQPCEGYERLSQHAKTLSFSFKDLNVFDYRFMVLPVPFELSAEAYLIRVFQPPWNTILSGIGHHMEPNYPYSRTKYDTVHPGRTWADNITKPNRYSKSDLENNIVAHLASLTLPIAKGIRYPSPNLWG